MHDPATLAQAVRSTEPLLTRFLDGFDDDTRIRTASGLPNHASWTLGHLAITHHRAADVVLGFNEPQHLPTEDWVHGDGTAGDPSRYDTESVSYGSKPVDDPKRYPRWVRSMEIHKKAYDKLFEAVAQASPKQLEREVKWGGSIISAGDLVTRMLFHTGTHAGQLIDLRRALGMPRVVG